MFFGEGKIGPMRETILAGTAKERRAALAKLLPLQRADFAGIFRVMNGRPVTIRTLDPPLHEFLPHDEAGQREVAAAPRRPLPPGRGGGAGPAAGHPQLGSPRRPPPPIHPPLTQTPAAGAVAGRAGGRRA